jgi:hypothetical protein
MVWRFSPICITDEAEAVDFSGNCNWAVIELTGVAILLDYIYRGTGIHMYRYMDG